MAADPLDTLEIFFGEANPAEARIYVRCQGVNGQHNLRGVVVGPTCEYSRTLPARVPLVSQNSAAGPLAQAIVPDPCFWSPRLPFLYEVRVELSCDGAIVAEAQREIGLRLLGARGRRLYLEGKGWVLRGAGSRPAGQHLDEWRDAGAAMLVAEPDDALCHCASRLGVLLLAEVSPQADVAGELRRLARWPAVGLAVLPAGAPRDAHLRSIAPNLLLAQRFAADDPIDLAPWSQAAVCEVADIGAFRRATAKCPVPVIAQRDGPAAASIAAARRLCDELQRDLAGQGEFAGYLV